MAATPRRQELRTQAEISSLLRTTSSARSRPPLRQTAQFALDPSAHLAVRVLHAARVADHPRDEESGHARLQSAGASVLAQCLAEGPRLRPSLELRDPLGLPRRLSMYRVLQPLHELLEMCHSSLERPKTILPRIDAGSLFRLISRFGTAPNPADPRDQSIRLAHPSPPARTLGRNRTARIPPTLFLCHLANHQRTVLALLTHQCELAARFSSALSRPLFTSPPSPGRTIETISFGQPDPCLGLLAPARETDAPSALTT